MSAPARSIGLAGIVVIALNAMIGTGIFALPGTLHRALGDSAPLLLLAAGLGMACVALSFGDCARHFDRSGGPLLYVGHAFGPLPGFVTGWLAYVARLASTAANATVVATTLALLVPALAGETARALVISLLFALLIALNIVGVRRALAALGAITLLKLAPLLLVAGLALVQFGGGQPTALPPLDASQSVALAALYAFVGFEAATVPAAEAKDPRRTIPLALVLTVAALTLVYATVQWAYDGAGLAPSETPLVDLARATGGPALALVMAAAVIVSVIGNMASALLSNSRITVGMADQAMIPARLGAYGRFGTPTLSILLLGLGAWALALSGSFLLLAVVSALARLFAYLGCIAAAPRLDHQFGASRGLFRRLVAPAIGTALCLWAMAQARPDEWRMVGALALAGALLYFLARKDRSCPQPVPTPSSPPTA